MAHGTPRPDRLKSYPNGRLSPVCYTGLPNIDRVLTTADALLLSRWEARCQPRYALDRAVQDAGLVHRLSTVTGDLSTGYPHQ